jgi:hypothetical protein
VGGVDSPNINAEEVLKAILTKEVDMDKLFKKNRSQLPQQAPKPGQPQAGGLLELANNVSPNQRPNG